VGRSAFISRREGRYLFRSRLPACLARKSGSAFRISLRTGEYKVAVVRAARIASWMLNVKAAEDPKAVLLALWPRLQAVAVDPVKDEADLVERRALQNVAFDAQFLARHAGLKPNDIAPGWDEHFVALLRENSRAISICEKAATVEGRIERRRAELFGLGSDLVVPPPSSIISNFAPAPKRSTDKLSENVGKSIRLSEALASFLRLRSGEDGDDGAKNDIAPVVQFAIDLWKDPWIGDIGPNEIVQLKQALPEVPTTEGLPVTERSLFRRWSIAKKNDYVVENEGKKFKLKRVSQSTLDKRYRTGLNVFWTFLIDNSYVVGPAPDFSSKSKHNPPAVERDAFQEEELLRFLATPLFTGCNSISRIWIVGEFFCQTFFYWAVLIQLLCGLRPGEIAQFRCADIAELYNEWHFRFAKRSLVAGDNDENEERDEADTEPGGNDAKTKNAYRWVPIHPLLCRLGLLTRRDAIVANFIAQKTLEAGGQDKLSIAALAGITEEAQRQWLFPDWKVYVMPTGEIRWSQAVSKSWQYAKDKFRMTRKGLALYSARHTFKGFIDDLRSLSERSRRIVMGHAAAVDTAGGYGPKVITEEQAAVILQLSNRTIDRMAEVLLRAKEKSERGELKVVDCWRNDERAGDKKLQIALARRAEEYR
jgi:integrase